MFEAILVLTLSTLNTTATLSAGISPCVWPKCSKPTVEVASTETFDFLGEIETCQWPKKCAAGTTL